MRVMIGVMIGVRVRVRGGGEGEGEGAGLRHEVYGGGLLLGPTKLVQPRLGRVRVRVRVELRLRLDSHSPASISAK